MEEKYRFSISKATFTKANNAVFDAAQEARHAISLLSSRVLLLEAALRVLLRHNLMGEFVAECSKNPDAPRPTGEPADDH